jgi:hypothetical protein
MKLLTIAIPTYKRPMVLIQCIESIIFQLGEVELNKISILISDNDPDSKAEELLGDRRFSKLVEINYLRNATNIGAELNFMQCARLADRSRYLWILGDDDFPVPGLMKHLLTRLEDSTPDIAFVECRPRYWEFFSSHESVILHNRELFLAYVNYHITFVSGFILPVAAVKRHLGEAEALVGSLIPHLGWVFPTLMNSKSMLLVPKISLTGGKEGTGGYQFGEVFIKNFWCLWRRYTASSAPAFEGYATRVCRLLMQHIFYPSVLLAKKKNSAKFQFGDEQLTELFQLEFKNSPRFAWTVSPFLTWPLWLLKFYRIALLLMALPIVARLGWDIRKRRETGQARAPLSVSTGESKHNL